MALTTSYKRGKGPRAATKHNVFNKGMFYGDQIIPEGYAKVLVNYRINDTGDALYTKPGRTIRQQIVADSQSWSSDNQFMEFGEMHLTDYLYHKLPTNEMLLTDTLFSFGKFYDGLNDTVNSLFPDTSIANIINKPGYYLNFGIHPAGASPDVEARHAWMSRKEEGVYTVSSNLHTIGAITALKLNNEGMFDLSTADNAGFITSPVYTIHNNEIYCFAADKMDIYDSEVADPHVQVGETTVTDVPYKLCKLVLEDGQIIKKPVVVYDPTFTEVIGYADEVNNVPGAGYNMLSPNPYVFKHTFNETHKIMGGVLMDSINRATAKPVTSPNIGTKYYYWLYLDVQASPNDSTPMYNWKCEHRSADSDITYAIGAENEVFHTMPFNLVNKRSTGEVDEHEVVYFEYTPEVDRLQIKVTIRRGDDANTDYTHTSTYIECNNKDLQDIKTKNYDLSTAKGMFSWKGVLGLYGVKDAESTVFFSDVDNPGYFPFPNNIEDFGNEVLMVKPANDKLIVVTVDSIYIVTGGPATATMIKKQILANTYINPLDAQHIQILKDQIFFKTNDQFYVLKPNAKTSDSTDLKNYLNSQQISPLFEGFREKLLDVLNSTYLPILVDRKLNKINDVLFENLYSDIVKGKIHYTLKLHLKIGVELFEKVFLSIVYDPITRVWTLELQAVNVGTRTSQISLSPYTQQDTPLRHMDKATNKYFSIIPFNAAGDPAEEPTLVHRGIHLLEESDTESSDKFDFQIGNATYESGALLDNYQYIETGSTALEDTVYKRFRELQFNVYNNSRDALGFYTTLLVDGVATVYPLSHNVMHITDKNDPDYGKIFIEVKDDANLEVDRSLSIVANLGVVGDTQLDFWELDLSSFPDLALATVRLGLVGKGRRASLRMLNTSVKKYNISNFTWVYRVMNAR